MDRDAAIRDLRREFALAARKGVEWIPTTNGYEDPGQRYPAPTLKEQLAERHRARELRRNLFDHKTFHRFLDNLMDIDQIKAMRYATHFVAELHSLQHFLSFEIETDVIKDVRQKYLRAKGEVETAARVLRFHAKVAGKENQQVLMDAALKIEQSPHYAMDGDTRLVAVFVDFAQFGQQGDARAYAIRRLDDLLLHEIPNRDSMIRDFLKLIGINASSQLVRSTRLKSKT